jgi:hypothetical protein
VEQDQGLLALAGQGVPDRSAADFDEGSFADDLVSSGRIDQFAARSRFLPRRDEAPRLADPATTNARVVQVSGTNLHGVLLL